MIQLVPSGTKLVPVAEVGRAASRCRGGGGRTRHLVASAKPKEVCVGVRSEVCVGVRGQEGLVRVKDTHKI